MTSTYRIPNTKIVYDTKNNKIHRHWIEVDKRFHWKPPYTMYFYSIGSLNGAPKPRSRLRAPGTIFAPADHDQLSLEHFVYVYNENNYLHLPTGARFTGRQINRIFPEPLIIHREGRPDKPLRVNFFIRRHASVNVIQELP